MMSMNIQFEDGSNPWIMYNMTPEEFARQIRRWSRNFELTFIECSYGHILSFFAKRKGVKK